MFKADQVEMLKSEIGPGDGDLTPEGSGALGGEAGRSSGALSLADSDPGRSSGLAMSLKEDTALAGDLGLSGSVGSGVAGSGVAGSGIGTGIGSGVGSASGSIPSPRNPGSSQTGMSGSVSLSGAGRSGGVDIFQQDDVDRADPSAQTAISPGSGSGALNLEGVGSGSGLLDLTRESDDTSLGAELLDEIAPSASKKIPTSSGSAGMHGGSGTGITHISEPRGGVVRGGGQTIFVEAADPMSPVLGGAALGAAVVLAFAAFAVVAGVMGTRPPLLNTLIEKKAIMLLVFGIGVIGVSAIVGFIIGKTTPAPSTTRR
jgi:hypothetical protein